MIVFAVINPVFLPIIIVITNIIFKIIQLCKDIFIE